MASRLWVLVQAAPRFVANPVSWHIVKPPPKPSYSILRLLCADRKSDTFESAESSSHVGNDELNAGSEEVTDPTDPPKIVKSDSKLIKQIGCSF